MTRHEVARYVATRTGAGRGAAIEQAAAWLIESGRSREASYLASDVANILSNEGYLMAKVTTARELSGQARSVITSYLESLDGVREVELVAQVDPSLIGGVRIETPGATLDTSLRRKLTDLREGAYL